VTEMGTMFFDCTNLRAIFVGSDWTTASLINSDNYMFDGCTSLVGGQGTTYDAKHEDATYAHIDGGPSNPGYLSDKNVPMAYACYTPSNTTLTFHYDTQRSYRSGTTYTLNLGEDEPGWSKDGTNAKVTKVVFDPSFADARPTTTCCWLYFMSNLQSITGLSYLNTSQVTNMEYMFSSCSALTRLDLGNFNTSKVTTMPRMFWNCTNLHTIYVGSDWSMANVTESRAMFDNCTSLVGGQGTTYDANHVDATYAHIDGGPSNPGYFTDKNTYLLGDVNGDREVNIADVNAVIDIILGGSGNTVAADVNGDGEINIADINAVIDIILGRNAEPEPEHDWVDLGLPSGTLWATCNVGANSPEEFGHHFAWGETEPKDVYDWSTYKWCNGSYTTITKYCTNSEYGYNGFVDNKTELDLEDDAAYVNWGPSWCMPTVEQQQELYQNCSSVWTTKNGVNGRLFTGPNGNTLFLPAAGGRWDGSLYYVGSYGCYWSRTLYTCFSRSDLAYNLDFTSGYVGCDGDDRIIGFTVRAVRVSQN
jgi:surface protein